MFPWGPLRGGGPRGFEFLFWKPPDFLSVTKGQDASCPYCDGCALTSFMSRGFLFFNLVG